MAEQLKNTNKFSHQNDYIDNTNKAIGSKYIQDQYQSNRSSNATSNDFNSRYSQVSNLRYDSTFDKQRNFQSNRMSNGFQDHPIVNPMTNNNKNSQIQKHVKPYDIEVQYCESSQKLKSGPQNQDHYSDIQDRQDNIENSKQIASYNTNDSNYNLRGNQQQQFAKNTKELMITSIQNEIGQRKQDLRELINDLTQHNDTQNKFSKKIVSTISSLEEFLNLAFDAIKMQGLDLTALNEQLMQQDFESQQLYQQVTSLLKEKEDLTEQYNQDYSNQQRTIQQQEQQIFQLKQQIEQQTQDYELLKQQLMIKDTLHLAQEQMSSQRQYFENIAFQNSHLQLELKKISEQFREYVAKHEQSKQNTLEITNNTRKQQVLDEKFYVNKQDLNDIYDNIIFISNKSKNENIKDLINEKFKGRISMMIKEQEYGMLITSQMRFIQDIIKQIDSNNDNSSSNNIQSNQTNYSQNDNHLRSNFKSDQSYQDDASLSKNDILQINDLDSHYLSYIHQIQGNPQQIDSNRQNQKQLSDEKFKPVRQSKSTERYGKAKVSFVNHDKIYNLKAKDQSIHTKNSCTRNESLNKQGKNHDKCLRKDKSENFDISNELKQLKSQSPDKIKQNQRFNPKQNLRSIIQKNQTVEQYSEQKSHKNNNSQQQTKQRIVEEQKQSMQRIATQKDVRLTKAQQQLKSNDVVLLEYLEPEPIQLNKSLSQNQQKASKSKSKSRQASKFQHDYEKTSFNQQATSPKSGQKILIQDQMRKSVTDMFSPQSQRDRTISPDKLKNSTSPNKLYNLGITIKDYKPIARGESSERQSLQNSMSMRSGLKKNPSTNSIGIYNNNIQQQLRSSEVNPFSPDGQSNRSNVNFTNQSKGTDIQRQVEIKRQITQRAADKMKQKYMDKQRKN